MTDGQIQAIGNTVLALRHVGRNDAAKMLKK